MILAALRAALGEAQVLGPDAIAPRYFDDETGGTHGAPVGLVRPGSTQEVSEVLRLCLAAGQAVVVQGGRTGLTRAALPRTGELVLSLERLNRIEDVDATSGTMTLGAGTVLQVAQDAAAEAGWRLAVDIGARGSCTIGGMIATNAGGHQVFRHGMMRAHVLGLEAVLADGSVVSAMQPMLKNNTGYDWKHLLIGAEGTLGVVTRALLRLQPGVAGHETALCALPDYTALVRLLALLQARLGPRLASFEAMWDDFLSQAVAVSDLRAPFEQAWPCCVLVETEGPEDGALGAALEEAWAQGLLGDALLAQSGPERARFWAYRDAIGEITRGMALFEPFDVGAPTAQIGALVEAIRARLAQELGLTRMVCFGHVADGNLHIALELACEDQRHAAEAVIYAAVRAAGGTVSAEHGIGLLKRGWLGHTRSADEIALMRRLRGALDPHAILNPGRIFDMETPR
ncbi:FAD-binding oxidoreductase [Novosphingobium decolorationis]|uniref:FAD-binding oxidoreductase n=1 Tax=Novosphingobium decolorationis TaxID=2698673 RepID=A0ABX8E7F1_9SPHN|nr:FAD-binding oxidoreductase [Novosphingobium decolorationis]QVM84733.1 FAD-binding oxidoreductase [Novosphingobium decolorationis]